MTLQRHKNIEEDIKIQLLMPKKNYLLQFHTSGIFNSQDMEEAS